MMLDFFNKYDDKIISRILQLDKEMKCILILSEIKRQEKVIVLFDKTYKENLCDIFNKYVEIGTDLTKGINIVNISNIISTLEHMVPDTDDYSRIEGTLAQNGIISLVYFFEFYNSDNDINFVHSISKVLETIDSINYNKNPAYNKKEILEKELEILYDLLIILKSNNTIDDLLKLCNEIVVKNYIDTE